MNDRERRADGNKVIEKSAAEPDYRGMIIELVWKIQDKKFLRRIFISLRDYLKEKAE